MPAKMLFGVEQACWGFDIKASGEKHHKRFYIRRIWAQLSSQKSEAWVDFKGRANIAGQGRYTRAL